MQSKYSEEKVQEAIALYRLIERIEKDKEAVLDPDFEEYLMMKKGLEQSLLNIENSIPKMGRVSAIELLYCIGAWMHREHLEPAIVAATAKHTRMHRMRYDRYR